jgi:hypothetical protein
MKVSKTPLSLIQGLMSGDDKVSITRDISSPEGLGGSFLLLPKSLENAMFSLLSQSLITFVSNGYMDVPVP